jgi:hypothetical protein
MVAAVCGDTGASRHLFVAALEHSFTVQQDFVYLPEEDVYRCPAGGVQCCLIAQVRQV